MGHLRCRQGRLIDPSGLANSFRGANTLISLVIDHEQRGLSFSVPRAQRAASSYWSQLKTADPKREVEAFLTLY